MLLALTGNIREGWKGLPRTGTLIWALKSYEEKSFITPTPDPRINPRSKMSENFKLGCYLIV